MRSFLSMMVLLSHVGPCSSFQNGVLRFLFRKMTPDCNWPDVATTSTVKPNSLEDCKYFDADVDFPGYYLRDFHAYTGGNLNPIAAREARSATSAVMKHHYDNLTGEESSHYIRSVFSVITRSKNVESFVPGTQRVVDFGCGIGVSTHYLRDFFLEDSVIGIDLSPFYLEESSGVEAEFLHGNVETTPIESGSVDVVSISYVLHELPYDASIRVIREAFRILKPGTGVLSVLDMHNPKASSPLMSYIFDKTEPYLKEYSRLVQSMESDLDTVGFRDIEVSTSFPKTVMWFAKKNR